MKSTLQSGFRQLPSIASHAAFVAGAALFVHGVAMLSHAAAFIAAGILLAAGGFLAGIAPDRPAAGSDEDW